MREIDNGALRKFIILDRDIKEKTKEYNTLKQKITDFLEKRDGKALVTKDYIAAFQLMNRTAYEIPKEIKAQYKITNELKILKVTEKVADDDS